MNANAAKVKSIFLNAVEHCGPDGWPDFLDRECDGNAELRIQVERLLSGHRKDVDLVEQAESALDFALPTLGRLTLQEKPGSVIGPYTLLEQIGEGGMGVVFMAEQTQPIQRTVALKIIKPGMDTRQVIARFEAERQALALMDHPNIARVLDAGTTDTDRPYFVMDLVKGVPITEYCDRQSLSVRQRLELVVEVCHAVQHAHQKGIIHRDLKPSNVLVAEYDGQPVPKIIDFGVAKATAQRLTARTMFTQYGQIVGTFEYMSPEQSRFNQLDVDTRSDIYSLGVLLYELLVGSTPLERHRLETAAFDETLRIIREEEPPNPSTRLDSSEALPSIAAHRRLEPGQLSRLIRGELDWIVMKCLEKDRNRRYETASALAADVMRYLADEPVTAAAPTRLYRASKFVRRNKGPVIASAAMLAGLIAGMIGVTIGLVSQSRQRAIAELERAEAQLNLASALQSQEKFAEAEQLYRQGLAAAADGAPEDWQRAARTLLRLAGIVRQPGESERLYRQAIAAYRAAFPPSDPNIAHALLTVGLFVQNDGRWDEAEPLLREAYEIHRHSNPADHRAKGVSAAYLGHVLLLHYLDTTPLDDAEFTTLTNPYTGHAPNFNGTDLYATVLHEIGHAMGFDQDPNLLASTFTADTGIDDPNTTDAGNLLALNIGGGPIEATFTAADTGHIWEGPGNTASNNAGLPTHPETLMNSGRAILPEERNLISDFEANLLAQIYGYTISLPSGHNNMMVNYSLSTSVLTVVPRPGGSFVDAITFDNDGTGRIRVTHGAFSETTFPAAAIASINVSTGENNDFVTISYNGGTPTTVNGGNGSDSLTLNNVQFATVFTGSVSAAGFGMITHNLMESMTINGTSGNDGITVTAALIPTQINTGLGDDTVDIAPTAGGLHTFTNNVDWDGGGGADSIDFELGTTSFAVRYNLDPTGIIAREISGAGAGNAAVVVFTGNTSGDSVNVKAGNGGDEFIFAPQALGGEFHGGNGDDTFTLGGGNLGTVTAFPITSYNFFGDDGSDTLELDDSSYTDGTAWLVESDVVIRFTPLPQFFGYAGFEGVSVLTGLGGTGGNSIEVEGSIFVNLSVTGGAGSDAVILTDVSNFRDFFEGENDPPFHFDFDIDGGSGFNTLTVDDTTSVDRSYIIRPDNVIAFEGAPLGLDFDYDNFQSMTLHAGPAPIFGGNEFHIFGTPADIPPGQQMRIFGGPVADHLVIYPRDAAENLTINSEITFQGNAGVDTILVDASTSPLGLHYQMAGGTLTGMGAGSVVINGNEQLTFNAGSGSDIWTTVLGPLSNPPTTINAGGGANTFNLDASLTPIAWTINGGPNLDTLNLSDSNNPSPSTSWNINATSVIRTRSDGGTLPKVYTHSGVERINVNGGGSVDLFFVDAVAPGQTLTLNAGAGLDGMLLGSQATNNLDSIQGAVVFNGQAGGGNIAVLDANDPTGDVVHLTQTSLGAYPSDTLFGAGGSLTFSDLVNFGVFPGITLNLGTGSDTVFAEPLPVARVNVNGGNPTSSPGDNFRLSLAGVTSPVFTPNGAGAGTYTFGNRDSLNYTGFEAASAYIPGDYSGNGIVGPEDYNIWRGSFGMAVAHGTLGDGNGDGFVDAADYVVWRKNLGAMVPASGATVSATAGPNVVFTFAEAKVAYAKHDLQQAFTPSPSSSGSTSPSAPFTESAAVPHYVFRSLRQRPTHLAIAPQTYIGLTDRIVDLAYQDLNANRSKLTDDDLTVIARRLHDRGQPNDHFDHGNEIDSGIDVRVALPHLRT